MKINPSVEAGSLPLSDSAELLPADQTAFPEGYRLPDDCTDPNLIQRYIAAQMGRTVEACIEIGRGLTALKALCQHGEFLNRIGELGLNSSTSQRFMAASRRFSGASFGPLLSAVGKQSKLFELLPLDDEKLEALALQGRVGPLALSKIPEMTVKAVREAVKQCREARQNIPSATLRAGDRIESPRARRPGTVVKVYDDGSACVCWDDGEPQEAGLGHERVPGDLLVRVGAASDRSAEAMDLDGGASEPHDALPAGAAEAPSHAEHPEAFYPSVDTILAQAKRIGNHASEDAKSAIQLGWVLITAKRQIAPGHFGEFVKETMGISRCMAGRMMKAAMLFPDIEHRPEICELGFSKLTELLWENEDAVRGLVDGGTLAGCTLADFKAMTALEIRRTLKAAAQAGKHAPPESADPDERRRAYLVARVATLVGFADDVDLNVLDDVIDELVSDISNSRFVPGLVAEDYALTHRFLLSGGVQ